MSKENQPALQVITIEVPDWAIGWFQIFVGRSHFGTYQELACDRNVEEACQLRDAVSAVSNAIIKGLEA